MIKVDQNTDFYPEGEEIQLPSSFKEVMQQTDGSYIYGNRGNGRELKYSYLSGYGYGWTVKKINLDWIDDCCEG